MTRPLVTLLTPSLNQGRFLAETIESVFAQDSRTSSMRSSFNENEPIICTPGEALTCFLKTRMGVLVLRNHVIER